MIKFKEIIETYKCLECKKEYGIHYASFDNPACPECGEHIDIHETTDKKYKGV